MTTAAGRVARTAGWTFVAAALALGGSGLVAEISHPPGGDSREELTYAADVALAPRLDAIATQLTALGTQVDALAGDARSALAAVSSDDSNGLQAALASGSTDAQQIQSAATAIRESLANLPGDGPDAATLYSNATLLRRAALLAALGSLSGINDQWTSVAAQAGSAAQLTLAIQQHDTTVAAAAAKGVQAQYAAALVLLTQASSILDQITLLREQKIADTGPTVLDDWIDRNSTYDEALSALYQALQQSGGKRNAVVDAAYRSENIARQDLPDNRSIILIVSEVAQGGLNQAVVAIEDARGRVQQALAAVAPGTAAPAGSSAP